jgi:hypothetical protein
MPANRGRLFDINVDVGSGTILEAELSSYLKEAFRNSYIAALSGLYLVNP